MGKAALVWVLVVVAAGCGDDSAGGKGDGGLSVDGSGGGDGGVVVDAAPAVDAAVASLSGTVNDRSGTGPMPVTGAVVSIVGSSQTVTTAADGLYSFALSAGQTVFVRAEKATFVPKMRGVVIPAVGAVRELELNTRAGIQRIATALSTPVDLAKGIVIVKFAGTRTDAGYGATLSAAHDPSFTFATGAVPTPSPTLLMNGNRDLIFFNVTTGVTTVTLTAPAGKTCVSHEAITSWRVAADTVLDLDVDCN